MVSLKLLKGNAYGKVLPHHFLNALLIEPPLFFLGGPKALRREADKLLDYVQYIKHEPILEPLPHDSQDFRRLLIISFQ